MKKPKNKSYASTYNVKILNPFNPQLQLKDTESTIKNLLRKLLSGLRKFKFVTTLVLEFKKRRLMMKQSIVLLT